MTLSHRHGSDHDGHKEWIGRFRPTSENSEKLSFLGLYEQATSEIERSLLSKLPFRPKYQFRSAAWSSVYAGVKSQIGMGILPNLIGDADPHLQKIFPDKTMKAPLWLVVHPEVYTNAKIKALISYLSALFQV